MNKHKINNNAISIVAGLSISLFSLLLILSNWVNWLNFITKGLAFVIGFIGFWILIPTLFLLGLYISVRQKLVRFKIGITFIGVFLIIFAVGLLTSQFATKSMTVYLVDDEGLKIATEAGKNLSYEGASQVFNAIFHTAFKTAKADTYIVESSSLGNGILATALGGGFFCFIFLGLFNQIGYALTVTLIVLLFVVGLILIFNRLIIRLFSLIKTPRNKAKIVNTEYVEETPVYQEEPVQELPNYDEPKALDYEQFRIDQPEDNHENVESLDLLSRSVQSFNNQSTLRPATFNFDTEEQKVNDNSFTNEQSFNYPNNDFGSQNNVLIEENNVKPIESYNHVEEEVEYKPILDFDKDNAPVEEEPIPEDDIPQTSSIESFNNYVQKPQPTYVAPQSQRVIEQPKVVEEQPVGPKKSVLHWDDDDEIEVDIPKAYPLPPYEFPPVSLLEPHEDQSSLQANEEASRDRMVMINGIFQDMKIGAEVVGYTVGPSVTQFDIKILGTTTVNQIANKVDDIAIRLGGVQARFQNVVLGKPTAGLEIPNAKRISVGLYESLITYEKPNQDNPDFTVPFGKDIQGRLVNLRMEQCPHLLVAGTTGSGKSVFIHSVILSLIMRNRPEDLKLILIDPKGSEMNFYKKIPHLICPMIDDPSKANVALKKLIEEMNRRNLIFKATGVKELKEFNKLAPSRGYAKLPTIIVFVDEYADLSERCKDIESNVLQIAQKARTAGIHLVIATQRPSTDIISGVVKANLPTRVALSVSKQQDSITILGESGAESLLGNGDMLIDSPRLPRGAFVRVQSAFADTIEINKVCDYLRKNYSPMYWDEYHDLTDHSDNVQEAAGSFTPSQIEKNATDDQLYSTIKSDVMLRTHCSISFIQRTYSVGFPKAGKIFARLQQEGIVDKVVESSSRGCKVLIRSAEDLPSEGMGSIEQSELVRDFDPNNQ